ncbi:MAG: alpha/beta hydrolase [Microthrixaceae bacterium]
MPTTCFADGVAVDYLRLGGPDAGPSLLFVHATGFCATVWRPMAEVLSERFDCWALDVRGHGRSSTLLPRSIGPAPPTTCSPWSTTSGATGRGSASATPWGGPRCCSPRSADPGRSPASGPTNPWCSRATSPSPRPTGIPDNHLADGAARRRATFPSRQAAFDNYASKPPMDVFDPRALDGYLERGLVDDPAPDAPAGGVRLACEPAVEAQVYRMGGRHSAWCHLAEVGAPVTIVVGDTSIPGPALFAGQVAERLPAGRLESHPDLGHFGPMQAPDRMAASVVAAFDGA